MGEFWRTRVRVGLASLALIWIFAGCDQGQPYQGQQVGSQYPATPTGYPSQGNSYGQKQGGVQGVPSQAQPVPVAQPSAETGYVQVEQPRVELPIYSIEGPPSGYLGAKDLGKLFDADFNMLPGQSPFAGARVTTAPSSKASHTVMLVENSSEFNLHAGLLDILDVKYHKGMKKRLAIARNVQESRYHELEIGQIPTSFPANAVYFLWRVAEGHLYEYALVGSKQIIGKDFGASLKKYTAMKPEANIGTLEEDSTLKVEAIMKGLKPKSGGSLFCHPDDISKCYTTDGATPEAIAVTYRLLPGRTPPEDQKISFGAKSFLPDRRKIGIERVTISPTKVDGRAWDGDGSTVDPFVVVTRNGEDEIFRTPPAMNVNNPQWKIDTVATLGPSDHLCVKIYDKDLLANDLIGKCTTKKLSKEKEEIHLVNCGQAAEVVLRVE